jgi:hypothetical protein
MFFLIKLLREFQTQKLKSSATSLPGQLSSGRPTPKNGQQM